MKNERPSRPVPLSRRLETIVELAGSGETVCDVGCDHAHVPIRLLQTGQFRRAIGMDVLPGPLGKAAGNLALYGMEDLVELRLSDGLDAFREGEADAVIITGMGGTLMRDILIREPQKTRSAGRLVLGPQSDPDKVRAALRILGFKLVDERLTFEDGKYYPVLCAVSPADAEKPQVRPKSANASDGAASWDGPAPGASADEPGEASGECSGVPFSPEIPAGLRREAEDLFGPLLLKRRDPVLREFLVRRTAVLEKIIRSISQALGEGGAAGRDTMPAAEAALPKAPFPGGAEEPGAHGAPRAQLRERNLARKMEMEHSLAVYRAALTAFGCRPPRLPVAE